MKKILMILLACMMSFSAVAQEGYIEETLVRSAKKKERKLFCGNIDRPIYVAGFMNYPPFGWKEKTKNEKGEDVTVYSGVGVELFKKFAKDYKLVFRYVNLLNYNEAVYALQRGYFDILVTDFYVSNPYSSIRYINPGYMANPIVIVSLKSKAKDQKIPQTLDDLKGKTGYVRKEENIYQLFHNQIPKDINIKQITGAKRAFYGLLKKEVDFLLMSQYSFEAEISRLKIRDYVTYSQQPVFAPYLFMSYAQGNPCARYIKKELERKIKEYTADQVEMKDLLKKQLIVWENKFIKEPSLMLETGVPEDDVEEQGEDIDARMKAEMEKRKTQAAEQKNQGVSAGASDKKAGPVSASK